MGANGVLSILTASSSCPAAKLQRPPRPFSLDVNPADFNLLRTDPDEFSLWQTRFIHPQPAAQRARPGGYFVDRDLKLRDAAGVRDHGGPRPGAQPRSVPRSLSVGRSFTLAIAIGFGYWLCSA